MITFQIIPNLMSVKARRRYFIDYSPEGTLADYLVEDLAPFMDSSQWVYKANGALLSLGDVIQDSTVVSVYRNVGDVATLTIVVGLVLQVALQAAIAVGLNYLMSKLLPHQKPATGAGGGSTASSPTYGWDGPQTMSDPGIPVYVILGKHRVGGNIVNAYVSQTGDLSVLNLLLAVCEGGPYGIQSIAGVTKDQYDALAPDGGFIDVSAVPVVTPQGKGGHLSAGAFYRYVVTFVTGGAYAGEIESCVATDPVTTVANDSIILAGIPASSTPAAKQVTCRRIYRNKASDHDHYYLVAQIDGDITTTYTDVKADTALGAMLIYVGNAIVLDDLGTKLTVNGNPVGNYEKIQIAMRHGSDEQSPIPGFDELHYFTSFNTDLAQNVPTLVTTQTDDTDSVVVSLMAPSIAAFSKSGSLNSFTISVNFAYRVYDPSDPTGADTGSWTDYGTFSISAAQTTAVRRQYRLELPSQSKWDIKITKTTADNSTDGRRQSNITLTGIDELHAETLSYPRTALLALSVQATNQLSGAVPNVAFDVEGLIVKTWNGAAWVNQFTRNPIWNIMALLTDKFFGMGDYIAEVDLDLEDLKSSAAYCDELVSAFGNLSGVETEPRYYLDCVLDSQAKALDWLQQLCACFGCWPLYNDNSIRLVMDRSASTLDETHSAADREAALVVTDVVGMGNIVKDQFQVAFAPKSQMVNYAEGQFYDELNQNTRDTVPVQADGFDESTDELVKQSVNLVGVVRRSQAIRILTLLIREQQQNVRSVTLQAGLDVATNLPGDVIRLSHDKPQWGVASGRIHSADASTFTVNKQIILPPLAVGEYYTVRVTHADDTQEEQTMTAAPTSSPLVIAALTAIAISGTFTTTPSRFDVFSIGKTDATGADLNGKPFRIFSIKQNAQPNLVDLSLTEYNESVYNQVQYPSPPVSFTQLVSPNALPEEVSGVTLRNSNDYSMRIFVGWTPPVFASGVGVYDHAEIWVAAALSSSIYTAPTPFLYMGRGYNSFTLQGIVPGRTYYVKIVAVSPFGRKALDANAPVASIIARAGTPPDVTGLQLKGQGNSYLFNTPDASFVWNKTSLGSQDLNPLDHPDMGAGAGAEDPYFAHYAVQIWDLDSTGTPRMLQDTTTKDPAYVYTLAQNIIDHSSVTQGVSPVIVEGYPARAFEISVWAVDVFNQYSLNSARLPVYNAVPDYIDGVEASSGTSDGHAYTETYTPTGQRFGYTDDSGTPQFQTAYQFNVPQKLPADFRAVLLWGGPSYPDVMYRLTGSQQLTFWSTGEKPNWIAVVDTFSDPALDFSFTNGLNWALITYPL